MCENCWQPMENGGLAWCDACGLVRYCGEVCKGKGWEEHKIECTFIGQEGAGGRVLNDQLRLVARIWVKIRREGSMIIEEQGDLMVHAEELMDKNEELLLAQYCLLRAVMKKEDMPDMKTFVSIYGKMIINSFSLRTDTRFYRL